MKVLLQNISEISSALTGLMLILVGGMLPSAIIAPSQNLSFTVIDIPSSWQVASLLICSLVLGSRASTIAVFAYLSIGLFYLPVFHGGGSIGYIASPDFGYLLGFIPAAWFTGKIIAITKSKSISQLFLSAIVGLTIIHSIGIINIILGTIFSRWETPFLQLLLTYSFSTFPVQLLLCPAVALSSKCLRKILLTE